MHIDQAVEVLRDAGRTVISHGLGAGVTIDGVLLAHEHLFEQARNVLADHATQAIEAFMDAKIRAADPTYQGLTDFDDRRETVEYRRDVMRDKLRELVA